MSSTCRSSHNAARQAAREREDVTVQEAERQLFGAPIRAPPDNNPNNFGAVIARPYPMVDFNSIRWQKLVPTTRCHLDSTLSLRFTTSSSH